MLFIYLQQPTPRALYAADLIFRHCLQLEYGIVRNEDEFRNLEGPRISYSVKPVSDEMHFPSHPLLTETGVRYQDSIPREPFALAFFLASRYEEYLPFTADAHGRFPASASLSFKEKSLEIPSINITAKEIGEQLKALYPSLEIPARHYRCLPTIDIDNAFAYRGKGILRSAGGTLRALLKADISDLLNRFRTLAGSQPDPYDTYDQFHRLHAKYHVDPAWFFLVGDWAPFDKNLAHDHPLMKKLVSGIAGKDSIGLHPSYSSNSEPSKVSRERSRLEQISGKPVVRSRQHFLKLRFPETYRNLVAAGIREDYTMGYADATGFRAGMCTPFPWYDLEAEKMTDLILHPFCIMDGTLNQYGRLNPDQALEKVLALNREVRAVQGDFRFIWHNESLSNRREWKGWQSVYEKILEIAR